MNKLLNSKYFGEVEEEILDFNDFDNDDKLEANDENISIKSKNDYYDPIKSYLKEVSQYKLLSFDEEKNLSKEIQQGNEDALAQLINSNLRLVIKIAKVFVTKDYSLMDIIQDGNIGLIRAAEKYDYKKNVRFSTYAAPWIKQMIIRALSQKKRLVRLPYRKEKTLKNIKESSSKFVSENRRYPTNYELSKELGIKESEIKNAKFSDLSVFSLESSINNDESNFTLENIVGNQVYNPCEILIRKDLKDETQKVLDSLYPKERTVLIRRFGLGSEKKLTLKEMGNYFGISAETVRQIENKTLRKLEEAHTHLRSYISQ
ncbi:MAG: RNA polymerase sigma factor RpoD/SigA [Spirochaetota bacterium]|nr:RNA polymerase sigma factor RpoD/SigA [Spirochaetota bacterium]